MRCGGLVLLDADQADLARGVGVAPTWDHVALELLAADVGAAGHDRHDPEARDPFGKRLAVLANDGEGQVVVLAELLKLDVAVCIGRLAPVSAKITWSMFRFSSNK